MKRNLVSLFCLSLAACSTSHPGGGGLSDDGGPVSDGGGLLDSTSPLTDSGSTDSDSGNATLDSGSTTVDAGVSITFDEAGDALADSVCDIQALCAASAGGEPFNHAECVSDVSENVTEDVRSPDLFSPARLGELASCFGEVTSCDVEGGEGPPGFAECFAEVDGSDTTRAECEAAAERCSSTPFISDDWCSQISVMTDVARDQAQECLTLDCTEADACFREHLFRPRT